MRRFQYFQFEKAFFRDITYKGDGSMEKTKTVGEKFPRRARAGGAFQQEMP
jgi:hypothetical protein